MELQKWNFNKQKYEPYTIPDGWHTPLIVRDMDEIINCASCGKLITFGDSYTSRKIHSKHGFGYCVCYECYEKECKEAMKWKS